jgi:hypothetical protein
MNSRQRDAGFIEWLESCNIGSGFQKIFQPNEFSTLFSFAKWRVWKHVENVFLRRKIARLTSLPRVSRFFHALSTWKRTWISFSTSAPIGGAWNGNNPRRGISTFEIQNAPG